MDFAVLTDVLNLCQTTQPQNIDENVFWNALGVDQPLRGSDIFDFDAAALPSSSAKGSDDTNDEGFQELIDAL